MRIYYIQSLQYQNFFLSLSLINSCPCAHTHPVHESLDNGACENPSESQLRKFTMPLTLASSACVSAEPFWTSIILVIGDVALLAVRSAIAGSASIVNMRQGS